MRLPSSFYPPLGSLSLSKDSVTLFTALADCAGLAMDVRTVPHFQLPSRNFPNTFLFPNRRDSLFDFSTSGLRPLLLHSPLFSYRKGQHLEAWTCRQIDSLAKGQKVLSLLATSFWGTH